MLALALKQRALLYLGWSGVKAVFLCLSTHLASPLRTIRF
uniref:Uncharacterized protein n=1 Tax=Utricularia reniformis TaxID=192314 RepID=A0A1Y0B2W8_9LAMI|nr:hypothetical protein AEK19_MT1554 [Utricularia reniformis]ART31741.1 hypothetical protein AEK19_MT1554 [Utricularia reniformis]